MAKNSVSKAVKAKCSTAARRTQRHDKIDSATSDMLKRMRGLRPELRAAALAQFLQFASQMAGIKVGVSHG
jgi:hypothetical protein